LWNEAQYSGEIDIALQHARRFRDLAVQLDDETTQLLAQRLLGISMHYAGDHKAALIHLQLMLARYDNSRHRLPILGASIDHSVVGRATMARVLWWLGRHDEALALSERVLREARDDGHAMMFCYVMVEATLPLALLAGKHPRALALIDELKVASNRAGFSIWSACCRCYAEYLAAASSPHEDRSGFYADALDMLEKTGFLSHAPMLQSGYALALAQSGDPAHASFVLNQTMARCRANGERWYDEELLATRQKVLSFADVADARWYQSDRADPTGPPTIAAHSLLHSAAMQDKNS
jgi:tetratricopeptide (TPR) repeat protein